MSTFALGTSIPAAKLNRDQVALAEAAKSNRNSNTGGNNSNAGDIGNTIADTAVTGQFGAQLLGLGAKEGSLRNFGNANLLSSGSNLSRTGRIVSGATKATSIPLFAYTVADAVVAENREDGKGLSQLAGEGLGNWWGTKKYGDVNLPALSDKEKELIQLGINPDTQKNQQQSSSYSPFAGVRIPATAQTQTVNPNDPIRLEPIDRSSNKSPFGATYLDKEGNTIGIFNERSSDNAPQDRRIMTPEEIEEFNRGLRTPEYADVPNLQIFSGDRADDAQVSKDGIFMNREAALASPMSREDYAKQFTEMRNAAKEQGLGIEERDKMARELASQYSGNVEGQLSLAGQQPEQPTSGLSDYEAKMFADLQLARDRYEQGGVEPSADQMAKASLLANSVGREFDPVSMEYTDFDPEIKAQFDARVRSGEISREMLDSLKQPKREAPSSRGMSDFERHSIERSQRIGERSDFNQPFTYKDGQKVAVTDEFRKDRDLDKMLKREARDAGMKTNAEINAYVEDEKRRRSEASEDRAVQKIMDDLNISNAEATLLAKQQKMFEVPDKINPSVIRGIQGILEDNDVSFDPQTGALATKDPRFLLPDGSLDLSPNSALYNILRQVEGGDMFLQPPPSVTSQIDNIQEGGGIYSDDGRFYVKENGELVQYPTPRG